MANHQTFPYWLLFAADVRNSGQEEEFAERITEQYLPRVLETQTERGICRGIVGHCLLQVSENQTGRGITGESWVVMSKTEEQTFRYRFGNETKTCWYRS
jgi:hypothetical protein